MKTEQTPVEKLIQNKTSNQQKIREQSNPQKTLKSNVPKNQAHQDPSQVRSRSREKKPQLKQVKSVQKKDQNKQSSERSQEDSYPEEDQMLKVMGFSSFATSKNKDHTSSAVEGVLKNSAVQRKYRQYMNRGQSLSRELDKI